MKKIILSIAIPILALCLYSCQQTRDSIQKSKDAAIQISLENEAEKFNKTGGKMLNEEIRIDSMLASKGKIMTYYYTWVKYGKEDMDTVEIKRLMRPEMLKSLSTNKELKLARENKVSFRYYYFDKNGQYAFRMNFIAKDSITD